MLLITLPFWFLALLAASVVFGWAHPPTRRRWPMGRWTALVLVILLFQATTLPHGAWAVAWYMNSGNQGARETLEDIDFSLSRMQREEVVRRALEGELSPSSFAGPEDFLLPDGFGGLASRSSIWVLRDACGIRVFFLTMTGFSPDPYSGFEYATPGCLPELDPLGGGRGVARDLGNGWYWINAS